MYKDTSGSGEEVCEDSTQYFRSGQRSRTQDAVQMVRVRKSKVKKDNVINWVRINGVVIEDIDGAQSIRFGNKGKLNLM